MAQAVRDCRVVTDLDPADVVRRPNRGCVPYLVSTGGDVLSHGLATTPRDLPEPLVVLKAEPEAERAAIADCHGAPWMPTTYGGPSADLCDMWGKPQRDHELRGLGVHGCSSIEIWMFRCDEWGVRDAFPPRVYLGSAGNDGNRPASRGRVLSLFPSSPAPGVRKWGAEMSIIRTRPLPGR